MEYSKQGFYSSNQNYNNDSALRIRLETSRQLQEIKQYLSGEVEILIEQDGKILRSVDSSGEPKANKKGIQAIVNRVSLLLNPSYVQGNYTEEQYNREIPQIRRSLRDALMINLHNWEICLEDYEDIIDSIMSMLKGFISRLINNEERKSYETTLRHIESASHTGNKKDGAVI